MAEAAFIDLARLARIAAMLVLGMLAIYVEAAPLGIGPDAPPSPDLLLCVVFYWTVRRPGSTPIPAVFALGVARDMLTDVPAGAGALALVLACEAVRQVRHRLARASFTLEWLALSAAALVTASFIWLLTVLTLTQPPYVTALFHQSLYTIMAYPLVVIAFRWVLRISWRKAAGPA